MALVTKRAEQARQTRESVLDSARALFAEQGYDATSLQQIADRMGVTKANVYYYFRTKDAILEALLTPMVQGLAALLDTADQVTDRDERVRLLVAGFVEQVVTAYRTVGSLNLGDPVLRRHVAVTRELDDLSERGLRLVCGPSPTADQQAGWYLTRDLAPVLRRLHHLPDKELKHTLERLCLRSILV
jgi:AcrR family transcriptional regulator